VANPKIQKAQERLMPTVTKVARAIEHRIPDDLRYVILVFAPDNDGDGLDIGIASNSTPSACVIAMEKMIAEIESKTSN